MKTRKGLTVLGLAIMLLVAGVGCELEETESGERDRTEERERPERTVESTTAEESSDSALADEEIAEMAYLITVRDQVPATEAVPDGTLLENARLTCENLDQGTTLEEIALIAIGEGLSGPDAGALVGSAIAAFCPEYQGEIDRLVETYG